MVSHSNWKLFAYLGISALALCTHTPALAAPPADPCNITPVPTIQSGVAEISPRSINAQRGWQRQGRDVEITVRSPKLPDNGSMRVYVCVRWQIDSNSSADIRPFQNFVQSGSTGGLVAIEKPAQLKIMATVPNNLPGAPVSPQNPKADKVTGVYAKNNAFPLADFRVVAFDGDTPVLDLIQPFGVIGTDTYCDMPFTDTTVDGGVGNVGGHKNWQPFGGVFDFVAKTTPKTIPANALVKVCFRWKLTSGDPGPFYESGPTYMLDKQTQSIKVAATVNDILNEPKWLSGDRKKDAEPRVGAYAIPFVDLVPLADARILIIDSDGSPVADVLTTVGITNLLFAWIIVIFAIVVAFIILWRVSKYRLKGMPRCNPLLSVITTRRGYASLSEFQIILWTFVVLASAVYVMALQGDLIAITTGTLVLLGISGSATVIAKAKSEQEAAAPPPPLDPPATTADAKAAEEEAQKLRSAAMLASPEAKNEAIAAADEAEAIAKAAKAKAVAADAVADAVKQRSAVANAPAEQKTAVMTAAERAEAISQQALKAAAIADAEAKKATRLRHPRWSDLVMEEIKGRELDVTRVQMLYFTLVTAAFVLLKVITSYEIPIIPEGFLLLMGISNSVYVGSKFATNPAAK